MTLRIERDALAEAVGAAARVRATAGLAAAQGVRMTAGGGRLVVTGTDFATTITVTVEAGDGELDLVAPAKLSADVIKSLEPGAVTLETQDHEVLITAGRSRFTLHTYSVADYPRTVEVDAPEVVVAGADLAKGLAQVVEAASTETEARPILAGVLFEGTAEGLRLVATDSYRLAVRDLPGVSLVEETDAVLVPRSALGELARVLKGDVKVAVRIDKGAHGGQASFSVGGTRITTRLIEGEFPKYRALLPTTQPNRLRFDRDAMLAVLRRQLLVASNVPVQRMHLGGDGLLGMSTVTAEIGRASEEIDADYEGTEMDVAFNPNYLAFGIEACTGAQLTLELLDHLKPATLRGCDDGDAYTYLLMPVRAS